MNTQFVDSDLSSADIPLGTDESRLGIEWQGVLDGTPRCIKQAVADLVREQAPAFVERYLEYLERDVQTAVFVATPQAREVVTVSMSEGLAELFIDEHMPVDVRMASQRRLGEALARMNYPIRSAVRGGRRVKAWIIAALEDRQLDARGLLQAAAYVSNVVDMSIELRSSVYLRDVTVQSRIDEAYRLHALGQNLGMERERQRAALMEWGHRVLTEFHRAPVASLPRLMQSEFGLWLRHKAVPLFEGDTAVAVMADAVERVDATILPLLEVAARLGGSAGTLIDQLQRELDKIKFSLAELFERHIEVEHGRDPLTRLLNRRFLPSVLTREIALQRRTGQAAFAILLIDLDHFKHINDHHGHDAGDLVLQQAASLIAGNVRPSDFVFRYGGEEFAVVLVESDAGVAARVAEKVRRRLEMTDIALPSGASVRVTASMGVAAFDGLADYQVLLKRADEALYRAKSEGRNRVVVA
jgi:diguanylate cyclase